MSSTDIPDWASNKPIKWGDVGYTSQDGFKPTWEYDSMEDYYNYPQAQIQIDTYMVQDTYSYPYVLECTVKVAHLYAKYNDPKGHGMILFRMRFNIDKCSTQQFLYDMKKEFHHKGYEHFKGKSEWHYMAEQFDKELNEIARHYHKAHYQIGGSGFYPYNPDPIGPTGVSGPSGLDKFYQGVDGSLNPSVEYSSKQLPGMQVVVTMPCQCATKVSLWRTIQHLNDKEKWSRNKIADWIDELHDQKIINAEFEAWDTEVSASIPD